MSAMEEYQPQEGSAQPVEPTAPSSSPDSAEASPCIDCPARLYAEEQATLIEDVGGDAASAKAYRTFGENIVRACRQNSPNASTRKHYFLFGEEVLVVDCASSAAKHHPNKITRRVVPFAPEDI